MASGWMRRPIVFPWERLQTQRMRYGLLAALFAAYLIFAGLQATNWGIEYRVCPWWNITGESCLLCGLTRSFGAMFRGDWDSSVQYHSFGPYLFLLTIAATLALTIAFTLTFRSK